MTRRLRGSLILLILTIAMLITVAVVSRRDVKVTRTFSAVSRMLDVEVRLRFSLDTKKWSFPLVCPLEINVATPPRRKLDDVRSYVRLGCVGIDLVFAHYRGPTDLR